VAKILVADDNSNIQKMVGLALKDHGIDVIAVGNGEAAVRKASDIRPDLILADVFMPVRNGYEVCEYVKKDPALAHIPVILLVGAFDPLDEQEAQRVGADGVLKKPFVPPDPLISMVKSALVRAGVAHAGFTPAKTTPEPPVEVLAPPIPPPPIKSGVPNFAPKPQAASLESESESYVDELPARPAVSFASGQQPVAFGSLLETPGTQADEEANEVTAVPALERDWRSPEADEEQEQPPEAEAKPSWRRDAGNDEPEEPEEKVAASGWRDAVSEGIRGLGKKFSGWAPTREKSDLVEAADVPDSIHAGVSDFRNIPAAPFSGEAWAAAIEAGVQNKTAVAEEEHPTPHAAELERLVGHAEQTPLQPSFVSGPEPEMAPPASHPVSFVTEPVLEIPSRPAGSVFEPEISSVPASDPVRFVSEVDRVAEVPSLQANFVSLSEPVPQPAPRNDPVVVSGSIAEPEKVSITPSWFSTPPNPWDAEAQKASKLASTWDTPITPAVASTSSFSTTATPDEIEVVSPTGTNSTIPEQISAARQELPQDSSHLDMDDVVARVLARLSPERLQEVARDLLKPVIETLIREELNKQP
jgi:CheY-like chemotaxis protein